MNQTSKREQEKEERREKRREEILQAAEGLFLTKGIHQTKIIDIAKACELGKGTLYFYFKSKDEIVWQLLKKYSTEEHAAGIAYVEEQSGTGYEMIERYLSLFSKHLIESYSVSSPSFQYRAYMASMVAAGDLTDIMKEEYIAMSSRNLSSIVKILEIGIKDGSIRETIEPESVGNAIGTAFGNYFRYVIGLKASFDGAYIEEAKTNFKAFTNLILSSIKQ